MLSGNNGILNRAGEARDITGIAEIVENAKLDVLEQIADNKGQNISKDQLKNILNKYFENIDTMEFPDDLSNSDIKLNAKQAYGGYQNIDLVDIYNGKFAIENRVVTLGEKYEDSMIGKTIDFKSEKNNVNEWVILGKQTNEQGKSDVIITTKNPVSTEHIQGTLAEWTGYEAKINNACKTYVGETGILGTKSATIKEVRSITLDDINNAVGFNETINSVTISNNNGGYAYPNSNGTGWIRNIDEEYASWPAPQTTIKEMYSYYNYDGKYWLYSVTNGNMSESILDLEKPSNLKYIIANDNPYWVASRMVWSGYGVNFYVANVYDESVNGEYDFILCESDVNGGNDYGGDLDFALRPCIVLDAEIPWDDVKDLISDYAQY